LDCIEFFRSALLRREREFLTSVGASMLKWGSGGGGGGDGGDAEATLLTSSNQAT
jgi:hypothetical protein